ncbi:protein BIG GRAIN 1-like A [Vigna unguiculata]|uniref:Protein BIG GRAIN 1-like A n=1 Tax=Vigna unguiculata TaxID=3917 RepID=A0A4D6MFV3_VIGUN|nr:protein BIG GRAIN 1-like A [Vigna unguiculata]QCD99178.1 hypothetical protein DEO72_LG7g459 [Vigna unguiculata]
MYNIDKPRRDDESNLLTPSFSTTLLDQIYRSIDEGERKNGETKFYRHTTMSTAKKQSSRGNSKSIDADRKYVGAKTDKKKVHREEDALFFSSTSVSSDSSFGFSSSDNESISRESCLAPRARLVGASASFRSERYGTRVFEGLCRNSHTSEERHVAVRDEEMLIKSKSRALKIYNNLKKVKQPISPGGRVTSFLNSLFANTKKTSPRSCAEVQHTSSSSSSSSSSTSSSSYYSSTCSSASSLSRSCLSKTMSSGRERMRSGVKQTVRFYPVSVIVGEDSRPCGHKRLCEEEEASRGFLREYRQNPKKSNDLVLKELSLRSKVDYEDDDDDDASSYASSDLFELDHLAVFGSERYCEELPVYETTHVGTNRAIANGLIV